MQEEADYVIRDHIEKAAARTQKLEAEINSIALDIQKCSEATLELDNWIYLMNVVQGGTYSGRVNDVNKGLKVATALRAANVQLKKEVLLQKKMQHDLVEETHKIVDTMAIEKSELSSESPTNITNEKTKMQESVRNLEQEAGLLQARSEKMALGLQRRPNFARYERVRAEIEELSKARRTMHRIIKLHHQQLEPKT